MIFFLLIVPLPNLCLLLKVSRVLETRPYLLDEYLRGKKISSKVDGVDTYSYRYAAKLRIDYKTFLIRIFESYFLPFQLWNRIVRAGHWPACLRQEHPFLRDQIENSGQKPGYTRCESWQSLFGYISTANASGLVVCFLKSQRAARNDQGIHFVCFWYCIFIWFSLFTLMFLSNRVYVYCVVVV